MKLKHLLATACIASTYLAANSQTAPASQNYPNNRYPLSQKSYVELPLGSIRAKGWLSGMLESQRSGMTSQMDKLYPLVMGSRNGWLGGDGDQWERGPYWIDGLVPLAYLLDDKALKDKAQPWIECTLSSQREDGFFGPAKDYPAEKGVQRNNSADWWPRMVALKYLMQYYSATSDPRVPEFMSRYFRYQLATLPSTPLGNWTFWAEYRACDNLLAVYWLYNITGERFLLELGDLIHRQSRDFTNMFTSTDAMSRPGSIHCVNLAQGLKEPVIYYQRSHNPLHVDAVNKGLADIKHFNGWPCGMYGGDEALHGNDPTQGSELCSAVEFMFSLEEMVKITGDAAYAEHLEKIAFNALPTQISDDFMSRQYFQQANQVMCTRHHRNFDVDHGGTDIVFGLLTGYPCCTSNLHQGWPKFTQNLWYATPDNGLAAMIYSPCEVTAKVASGITVTVSEQTSYPMDEKITFTVSIKDKGVKQVRFPLHLRMPSWGKDHTILVNGQPATIETGGGMAIVDRTWKSGDNVELMLDMPVKVSTWRERSVAVERGPLVYALRIEEKWEKITLDPKESQYGEFYWEVTPQSDWNYGFAKVDFGNPAETFRVEVDRAKLDGRYFWNLENAPVSIKATAKKHPYWSLYNGSAGPLPWGYGYKEIPRYRNIPEETITLVPYGCTTLRISEFPVL